MKLIVRILLIGAATYFLSPFLPWWTGMAVAFVICYLMPSRLLNAFISGFLAVGLVWLGHAWQLDVANNSAFSSKIVALFPVDDSILMVLLAGFLGGFSAGLSSISAASLRAISKKKKPQGYYS